MENRDNRIIEIAEKRYDQDFWKYHIKLVVKNALALTSLLDRSHKIDKKVVELAAYLHDIGRFREPRKLGLNEDHHIIGAYFVADLMERYGYEQSFIKKVEHCVLAHRGKNKDFKPETLEAKIVACADALAYLQGFLFVFSLFLKTSKNFQEAVDQAEKKIERSWRKLTLGEAQVIGREDYEAVRRLIKKMELAMQNQE